MKVFLLQKRNTHFLELPVGINDLKVRKSSLQREEGIVSKDFSLRDQIGLFLYEKTRLSNEKTRISSPRTLHDLTYEEK